MKFSTIGQESIILIDTVIYKSWEKIIALGYQVSGALLISNDQE